MEAGDGREVNPVGPTRLPHRRQRWPRDGLRRIVETFGVGLMNHADPSDDLGMTTPVANATYLGQGPNASLILLNEPPGGRARNAGVLVCPPFGWERDTGAAVHG